MPNGQYTTEEIGARARQRNPTAFGSYSDAQIGERLVQRNPQLQAVVVPSAPAQPAGPTGIAGVGSGATKTIIDAPRQFSESGMNIGKAVSDSGFGQWFLKNITKPLVNLLPKQTQQNLGNAVDAIDQVQHQSVVQPEILKRNTDAEKTGEVAANIGMLLLPGGAVSKGAKALETVPTLARLGRFAAPVARGVAEGISGATITAGQTGDLGKAAAAGALDLGLTAGLGALGPLAAGLRGRRAVASATALEDGVGGFATSAKNAVNQGKNAAQSFVRSVPERLMNNILRPPTKAFQFGKNPGRAVADLGIVGNSEEELLTNIANSRKNIGGQIGQIVQSIDATPSIDVASVFKPLDEAITEASKFKRTNQPLITRLEALRDDLTEIIGNKTTKINGQQAFDLKKEIGGMSKWTGQAFDSELNQARVGVYKNLRKSIEDLTKGADLNGPSLHRLNELYGNLVEAESALQNRIGVSQRNNMLNLGDYTAIGAGGVVGGGPGAVATFAVKKALGSTAIQTRMAVRLESIMQKLDKPSREVLDSFAPSLSGALRRMTDPEKEKFIEALPTIAKLLRMGILGAPSSGTPSDDQSKQELPQLQLER